MAAHMEQPVSRLLSDLEAIRQTQEGDAGGDGMGCFGMGLSFLCPTCSTLKRYRDATSTGDKAVALDETWISTRTKEILKRHGIETLIDLESVTRYELARMSGIGPVAQREVIEEMVSHGCTLKGETIGA